MSSAAIIAEGISKSYRLGMAATHYSTFGEALRGAISAPIRRWRRLREQGNGDDTIWALRDVGFEVEAGQVVGIIGRNGAGKSTLLKILSRITEPTAGTARLRGRVASLLEAGTGFHRELTGRDNIYLNGAILGMRKAEIDRKFDEIVAFAEIEKFLDTPVKHYSSGMYIRLAFAVAAHLDPEILLVDEVLAVGDAEFQRKCLGRMKDVASGGRTVLFVSHNMNAVQSLCHRVIILEQGRAIRDGTPEEAVEAYYASLRRPSYSASLAERTDREGTGEARYTAIRFLDVEGRSVDRIAMGDELSVELEFRSRRRLSRPRFLIMFINAYGQVAFRARTHAACEMLPDAYEGGSVRCRFPALNAVPGLYTIRIQINDAVAERVDSIDAAATLELVDADVYGTGRSPHERSDLVFMPSEWSVDYT